VKLATAKKKPEEADAGEGLRRLSTD